MRRERRTSSVGASPPPVSPTNTDLPRVMYSGATVAGASLPQLVARVYANRLRNTPATPRRPVPSKAKLEGSGVAVMLAVKSRADVGAPADTVAVAGESENV